jgi:dynein heavy chain
MGDDIDLEDLVPKIYEPISSWDLLQTKLINSMNKMNEEIRGSNMDLVFFKDAMIHLLRVRIIIRSYFFGIKFSDLSVDFKGY